MKMKAAVYVRVSTKHQAEKEISIQEQIRLCKQKALELGAAEIDVFADEGFSGADPSRPSLQDLLLRVRQGEYQLVVCYDVDRWARDLTDQLVFAGEVESAGAKLEFVTTKRGNGPEDNLFFQIKGAFAEYERAKIRQRSIMGKHGKARRGQMVTCSRPPYGYRYNGDPKNPALVVHEKEAEVVRMIYKWAVEEEIGSPSIARRLELMGIPSPDGKPRWHSSVVCRILRNEVYCGTFYNLKYKVVYRGHKAVEVLRPREEWVAIAVPPIVSRSEWELARKKSLERNSRARSLRSCRHLLTGMFFCGACGSVMSSSTHNRKAYYRCLGRLEKKFSCTTPYFMAEDGIIKKGVDGLVWEEIEARLRDPDILRAEYEAMAAEVAAPNLVQQLRGEASGLERTLQRLQRQKDELLDLHLEGLLTPAELKKRMRILGNRISAVTERLQDVRERISVLESSSDLAPSFAEFLRSLSARLESLTFEEKREVLRLLRVKVFAYPDGTVEVKLPVPVLRKDTLVEETVRMGVYVEPYRKNLAAGSRFSRKE